MLTKPRTAGCLRHFLCDMHISVFLTTVLHVDLRCDNLRNETHVLYQYIVSKTDLINIVAKSQVAIHLHVDLTK